MGIAEDDISKSSMERSGQECHSLAPFRQPMCIVNQCMSESSDMARHLLVRTVLQLLTSILKDPCCAEGTKSQIAIATMFLSQGSNRKKILQKEHDFTWNSHHQIAIASDGNSHL